MEVARGVDPDSHEDKNHLLPIAAFGIPDYRQLVFEQLLEGAFDGQLFVSGKLQVGRSFQSFKMDPLAETDLSEFIALVHRSVGMCLRLL
jgi:hypothetical protein